MIDPFSISFPFDDRTVDNMISIIEEMKEEEERKIREDFISSSNQLQV